MCPEGRVSSLNKSNPIQFMDEAISPFKIPQGNIYDEQNLFPPKKISVQFSLIDLGGGWKESAVFQSRP